MSLTSIDPPDLAMLLPDGSVDLIDVREADEIAESRLEGSRWIPLSQITARAAEISRTRSTVVMCHSGKRSAKAIAELEALGYTNLTNLEGGMQAWKAGQLPWIGPKGTASISSPAKLSIEGQSQLIKGGLVLLGVLTGQFLDPRGYWLSGFLGIGMMFNALSGC
jgi:rhodanese-related sulfurtransferase